MRLNLDELRGVSEPSSMPGAQVDVQVDVNPPEAPPTWLEEIRGNVGEKLVAVNVNELQEVISIEKFRGQCQELSVGHDERFKVEVTDESVRVDFRDGIVVEV